MPTRTWIDGAFASFKTAADLDALAPELKNEELMQGRQLSHLLLLRIYRNFNRLEVDVNNPEVNNHLFKDIKKLRSHLRFQHELEEEELEKLPKDRMEAHTDAHLQIISDIDYLKVLLDSSQLELGISTRTRMVATWFDHLQYFDAMDLGVEEVEG